MSEKRVAFAKWLGKQIAGKAISVALGAPVVTGAVMAVLAYLDGFDLAWGFFSVMGVAAFTSIALNQARAFSVAFSVADKLNFAAMEVKQATDEAGKLGYGLAVLLQNSADIPLEFRMDRVSADLEGRVAVHAPKMTTGTVPSQSILGYKIGVSHLDPVLDAPITGNVEFQYSFGRLGRFNHTKTYRLFLGGRTNAAGDVITMDIHHR